MKYRVKAYGDYHRGLKEQFIIIEAKDREQAEEKAWKLLPEYKEISLNRIDNLTENESWLLSCPCSDGNFKSRLKSAKLGELERVLHLLPTDTQKAKKSVLQAEISRRKK